jgi:hypothetical protein
MFSWKLKTAILAILAAGAIAGSAQASVIDTDSVKLVSTGYDFGSSSWALGAPTGSGEVHFHHEGGQIRPHLLGTIHLNDADGTCGRMRLEYFDPAGTLLSTNFGGEVCVTDDQHHSWSVDLDPYHDDSIATVRVSVQKETVSGWSTTASATYTANTFSDAVKITEDGVDFGSSGFSLGQPTSDGWVSWDVDNGVVTPRLTGTLHLNNSSGVCARMNIRYLTESGAFLHSEPGGTVCAGDNGHHAWSVDLSPYGSTQIGQVTIQLQTLASNGSWITAGSDTVSIAE